MQDKFGRVFRDIRISVTDRCNFRCPYCMPAEIFGEKYAFLKRQDLLSYEEITRILKILLSLGAAKVRLTGGEPLLRKDLDQLVQMIVGLEGVADLAMTTNAYLLDQHAQKLADAGLKRITVSLDSLDDEVFQKMNGQRASVADVLRGIAAAQTAGFEPIKINAVVQRGVNDHTLVELANYCRQKGHILRFIEYMDVGTGNGWKMDDVVSADEILALLQAQIPLVELESEYAGEVARRYAYADGSGEIGLITSVTKPFCGACTRMRLSAEGKIYTCLFASKGVDLKAPLREGASDLDLETILRDTWGKRVDRYSELRHQNKHNPDEKIEMFHIGG